MNESHLNVVKALATKGLYSPVGNSVLNLALQYDVTAEVSAAIVDLVQSAKVQNGIDEESLIESYIRSCQRL